MKFINEPQVPRKRPDMTTFIHRPLQHYREILKLVQLISSHSRADTEENKNLLNVINEFQVSLDSFLFFYSSKNIYFFW